MRLIVLIVVVLLCGFCWADIIYLQGGGVIVGRIVDRDDECVVVRMGSGARVTLSLERVVKIEEGEPEEIYRRKAARIGMGDADAHYQLGLWCEKVRLREEAQEEFEKALIIDPNHREVRRKLGLLPEEEKIPATKASFKDVERLAAGEKLTNIPRKDLIIVARALLEKRRRALLLLAGLTLEKTTGAIIARWHAKWEKARLAVLKKAFHQRSSITEEDLAPVKRAYDCLRTAFRRQLKQVTTMSEEKAKRRLLQMNKGKKRYRVAVRALEILGQKVEEDRDIELAEALLFAVWNTKEALRRCKGLDGWRRQMVVEVVAERIEAANSEVKGLSEEEKRLVALLNGYRRMLGRLPLVVDERLCRAAKRHAGEMRKMGYFGHISPVRGRTTPQERARAEGYPGIVGENLFSGDDPEEALKAWQSSPEHNQNMLSGWDPLLIVPGARVRGLTKCFWRALGVGIDEAVVALFGIRIKVRLFYPLPPRR